MLDIAYKNKYLKYKKKYLDLYKLYGGELIDLAINKFTKQYVLYIFNPSYNDIEARDNFDKLLYHILKNNDPQITTFLAQGTTKLVFNTNNPNIVCKFIIVDPSRCERFIKEPLYMLKNTDICNNVYNIQLYGNTSIIDEYIIVKKIKNIGNYVLITYYEDKALLTDISNFSPGDKLEARQFIEETSIKLTEDGFTDLGDVNVGLFNEFPKFRWIDIQPVL